MVAVITGVTGFIGSNLAKRLLKMNYKVYGVGRDNEKFKELELNSNFYKIILEFENIIICLK